MNWNTGQNQGAPSFPMAMPGGGGNPGYGPPPGAPPYAQTHMPPPGPPPGSYGGGPTGNYGGGGPGSYGGGPTGGYGGGPPTPYGGGPPGVGYGGGGYGGGPPSNSFNGPPGGGGGGYGGPPAPAHEGYNPSYAPPAAGPLPPRPPTQAQHYGPTVNGPHHQKAQPYFQYSQCTGKRKALLVGINYFKQDGELKGCINDVSNIHRFIGRHFNYKEEDIVVLTDDKTGNQAPTRANIIRGMQWLVQGAQPNDSLFFHYSGHGGQTKDLDGDEDDGYDEVIYPVDHKTAGHIVDDDMHDIMVRPLPAGCRLTGIFDSCHSGTALDLPYVYSTEGKIKEPNLAAEAGQGLLSAVCSYAKGDMGGVFSSAMGLVKTVANRKDGAQEQARRTKTSPADVIQWSGCKDAQTSADTSEAGKATGAMSYAFMLAWEKNQKQSYQELLCSIRDILKAKYSQKPQISASHPMDMSLMYIM
ncbi:caspase domain-containing protein [Pterulicium gracile]|uniref:Caspase domain-containing protein n=1 Tax=Pterulicium gracile TaxID=1884261 RepID=A0A5C3QEF7_9AGAR|nr:caspase domain-containing protein [Pterula gracilis]